jgi:hypothetical protein
MFKALFSLCISNCNYYALALIANMLAFLKAFLSSRFVQTKLVFIIVLISL